MTNFKYVFLLIATSFIFSCDSKPKVIVADEQVSEIPQNGMNTGAAPADQNQGMNGGVHQVTANEILQADRYTYLNVTEGGHKFWIATSKTEATKGQTYLYKGGLMKTNFESIEFKRTFDTIYLVSNIISATDHPGGNLAGAQNELSGAQSPNVSSEMPIAKDAIKLSELINNKAKYEGKVVTISGECVKVNNGIMGKNWIHIQDGSKENGKALDLTVTTSLNIAVGSKVALSGQIFLNKDFGAGYRYDIIMEEARGI